MDIAAIDFWANSGRSTLHRASALGKGIAALAFVAAAVVATSPYLLVVIYLLLVAGVFCTRLPASRLLLIAAYPVVFALLFAVSRWDGRLETPVLILLKALTAAQAMVLLITTTPYPDLFAALGRGLPGVLADGLFITYRSFFLLLREMDRMLTALRLRGGLRSGRIVASTANVSRALGMLLVRAVDLAERLYSVLKARGYRGRIYASPRWRSVSAPDLVPLAAAGVALALTLIVRLLPELWYSSNGFFVAGAVALAGVAFLASRKGSDRLEVGAKIQEGRAGNGRIRPGKPAARLEAAVAVGGESAEVARVGCLRHVYPDGTQVDLCGLDFVAHRGEKVVVLGPNGAGKSTLLNHLLGLLRPTEGEVVVLGHDPSREFSAIQPKLGVLLQNVDEQLLGPTVADDVAFGARNAGHTEAESREMAERVMADLGVLHLAEKVPQYLSGGQKRKVALAGALVNDPELLVLDEPFEGLDPRSRNELVELLVALNRERGLTMVMTTHHVDLLPILADKVYVMVDGGRIVASGTPWEVFSQPGVLQESSIEPPALMLLFQRLRAAGLDLGLPADVDDAVGRLIAMVDSLRSA